MLTKSRTSSLGRPSLEAVTAKDAAPPGGAYSQAIRNGGEVFVSGILPVLPDGTKLNRSSFDEQVKAVLANLGAILAAASSSPQKLVSVRVYITDIADWGTFNKHYIDFVGDHRPARAVVPVPCLHHDFELEVEAVAVI